MDAKEIRKNFQDLASDVRDTGCCKSVQMSDLRDRVGAGRLDDGPVRQIKLNLRYAGLGIVHEGHIGSDWALIYTTDSPVGRIVTAARGETEHASEQLCAAIKEQAKLATGQLEEVQRDELEQLRGTMEQIRALVSA